MKKIIIASALALVVVSPFAQAAGGVAIVPITTAMATTAGITNTQCAYVSNDPKLVPIKLVKSANVAAAFQCTATGVITGAAHTQGKKHGYISTSAGGAQITVDLSALPVDDSTPGVLTGDSNWTTAYGNLS